MTENESLKEMKECRASSLVNWLDNGITYMHGIQDKSRFEEEDYEFIWEHTEPEMPGGYQENCLITIK